MNIYGIIAAASNIRSSDNNPEYTMDDFLTMYPQFKDVSEVVRKAWIKMAMNCLQYDRWNDLWEMGMGLYIAHFLTLYLQSSTPEGASTQQIINAGLSRGIATSKSVADMSVGYDFGSVASESAGWGTFSQTVYGQQFVQLAKVAAMGGMTIW
jgi:hypothetical protein